MSTTKLTVTSELMKNYKQTELMSPEKKFEALQTSAGSSLLFSIGTDDILYVTQESAGHNTGWVKTDVSTAQLPKSFPGLSGLTCKTFEAAQSVVDGTIGMAMVITDGTNDHLLLSLSNSNSDTSWVQNPAWTSYPFDNPEKNIVIANVFLSETINKTQFIIVDIIRDPSSALKLISRYYIDTQSTNGKVWMPHDVSIDLEASSYTSCLGRQYLTGSPHQPKIDGLYTCGQVGGKPQLIFQALHNLTDPTLPAGSARLLLPGNVIPENMASCRKTDMSSDLYVCASGTLYYFASSNQIDGNTGVQLAQNAMFNGVKKMYAYQLNNTVIVWGLNGNDQIFYTRCTVGQELATPSVWTYPLPIVSNVDLFSPYINCIDEGNTFFVVAENTLQKLVKSAQNNTWKSQSITLPSLKTEDTKKYSSYTTHIQVTDENNRPVQGSPVSITASTRVSVYINHLYYVLGTTPVIVQTDQQGVITVIEWVTSITGTKLDIADENGIVTKLNPMDKPITKMSGFDTDVKLKAATITNDDGSTRLFVADTVSPDDLKTAAASNSGLGTVYKNLSSSNQPAAMNLAFALTTPSPMAVGGLDTLWVDIEDLFKWLESKVEAVIQVIEDALTKAWHFIVTIAGKVYGAIIDAVEKVAGAIEWVFNVIKTAIEDVIKFLEFLFGWDDILITHKVMKNVFLKLTQQAIDNLAGYKTDVTTAFASVQEVVNKWADIPNFDDTPNSTTASNPPPSGQNSAPANLGIHHFQGNNASASADFSPATVAAEILQDFINLMDSEEQTIINAFNAIKTDIIDQFSSLTVTQIIKKLAAIIFDTLLQIIEKVLIAAIDVFIQLAQGIISMLTATIDIPVISWLYKEISNEDLSVLDLLCLITAIPATIIYKIGANNAPFPKGDAFTNTLTNAGSFAEIQNAFFTTPAPMANARMMAAAAAPEPVLDERKLKIFGFMTGVCAFAGSLALIALTVTQRAADEASPLAYPKTLALGIAVANVFYVSPNIATFVNAKTDNWYQQMNNVLTGISIVKGFVNIPLTLLDPTGKAAKISPFIETFINTLWHIPVIMNIVDNHARSNTDYKSLIPESIGNFAFNLGGMMEFPIAMTKDPKALVAESVVQYILMAVYGVCMPIAGGIYEFVPGQNHS